MERNFQAWLRQELDRRVWQYVDLANKTGLSLSSISKLGNGKRAPSPRTCRAIAKAFSVDEQEVLWQAGFIEDRPQPNELKESKKAYTVAGNGGELEKLLQNVMRLSPEQRQGLNEYVQFLLSRQAD